MKRLLCLLGTSLLLTACTGVPTSSSPQTIEPLVSGPATNTPPAPLNLDGDPLTIVTSFLNANATSAANYSTARAYLTAAASRSWSSDTATVIGNDYTVSTYDPKRHAVTVQGRILGTLNANGIYVPSSQGLGNGGAKSPFKFDIAGSPGKQRIAKLSSGLLLTDDQFRATYHQEPLYFWDITHSALLPDLRWSPLGDRTQLSDWLIAQLAAGPRPSLQSAVSTDTLPQQTDVKQITLTLGNPTTIEIPGSSQLDSSARNWLAEQLSETLVEPLAGRDMSLTDGGKPVTIPRVQRAVFTATDFALEDGQSTVSPAVFYLNGGRIRDETGKAVALAGADATAAFDSFAVGTSVETGQLLFAAVIGPDGDQRLEVGTQRGGLHPTDVHGSLTRPAFVPGRDEVWIGAGAQVYRVSVGDAKRQVEQVPLPTASGGGQIRALRMSPEGARIAIVVSGVGGNGQLYIGSIVRGAGPVRIGNNLESISPAGIGVNDVAWLDSVRLFAIGYFVGSQDAHTFETGVDGTEWTNEGLGNLSNAPDTVTAATGSNVWIAANNFVWKQSGSSWVSPGPTGQTPGSAPVYVE